jgi:hypothetical protein
LEKPLGGFMGEHHAVWFGERCCRVTLGEFEAEGFEKRTVGKFAVDAQLFSLPLKSAAKGGRERYPLFNVREVVCQLLGDSMRRGCIGFFTASLSDGVGQQAVGAFAV